MNKLSKISIRRRFDLPNIKNFVPGGRTSLKFFLIFPLILAVGFVFLAGEVKAWSEEECQIILNDNGAYPDWRGGKPVCCDIEGICLTYPPIDSTCTSLVGSNAIKSGTCCFDFYENYTSDSPTCYEANSASAVGGGATGGTGANISNVAANGASVTTKDSTTGIIKINTNARAGSSASGKILLQTIRTILGG